MNKKVWLIGAGQMAVDYFKVLKSLGISCIVIGRSETSAKVFFDKTGDMPIVGGLYSFIKTNPSKCTHAIVSVGVNYLSKITIKLLNYNIKNILVEKPAGLNIEEIQSILNLTKKKKANVFVGYNRRFYASVRKAKEIIKSDGGLLSLKFDFTEWSDSIMNLDIDRKIKNKWLIANSTHVIDLAFFLGGEPEKIYSNTSGSLKWHPTASIFSGSGITKSGVLFSYSANWESAGRWSLHLETP